MFQRKHSLLPATSPSELFTSQTDLNDSFLEVKVIGDSYAKSTSTEIWKKQENKEITSFLFSHFLSYNHLTTPEIFQVTFRKSHRHQAESCFFKAK